MKAPRNNKLQDYITTVTILESLSDAIFILDINGSIEYANESALKLLQVKLDNVIGECIDKFLIDKDFKIKSSNNQKAHKIDQIIERFNDGIFENIEAALINENNIVPVILNFSVIKDNNKDKYIILAAKDITQWRQLEKKLKRQQAISISRDRLRMLGELSVGLIHELSQPLSALKMRLGLIASQYLDQKNYQEMAKEFQELNNLINRMESSIQNIRSYAHQTENNMISMVAIGEVLEAAHKLVVYELNEHNIRLNINKPKKLPYVLTNRLLLEQVFINLLKNSIDSISAMNIPEDTEKEIHISLKSVENKWVEIIIDDNGEGIDSSIKDKIFEPFFTTREKDNHSGIGLTISKNIISSLGGDIGVNNKQQQGARFKVRIPITKEDEKTQLMNLIQMLNTG
ncbi:MAG: PAS domain-containing protein [Candidatus Marinimicrobia bacterium]|nr:PAS domain-containing protein [Candidatus Neomarinimicrobiota bacterium]